MEFVAIDSNPVFHPGADVAAFTRSHGLAGLPNWHFLCGEPAYTQGVLAAFGMAINVPTVGMVEHSSGVLFVSADGAEAAYLDDGAAATAERLAMPRWSSRSSEISCSEPTGTQRAGRDAACACTAACSSTGGQPGARRRRTDPHAVFRDGVVDVPACWCGLRVGLAGAVDHRWLRTCRRIARRPAVDTDGGLAAAVAGIR